MSKRSSTFIMAVAVTAAIAATGPALAHPGPHHGMSFAELAQHMASGWHLLTLVAAAAASIAALVLGQRREVRGRHGARSKGDRP
jgi:Spy/CpxP family protein refolding chaperone